MICSSHPTDLHSCSLLHIGLEKHKPTETDFSAFQNRGVRDQYMPIAAPPKSKCSGNSCVCVCVCVRVCTHMCMYVCAQSCLTLCDSMDCSPPGFSVYGISQAKNIGVAFHFLLQGIFPTQGSDPSLLHCKGILELLCYLGSS